MRERDAELEGKQAPGMNVGRIPETEGVPTAGTHQMMMSEILASLDASYVKLARRIENMLLVRTEYVAAILQKERQWPNIGEAALAKLGVGCSQECLSEIERLHGMVAEVHFRFSEALRARLIGGESIPAPRTPAGNGKQTKKAKGRAR